MRGEVRVQNAQSAAPEPVSPDFQMTDGDLLATEIMSHAEVLLNSAAYLCLDERSEVRTANTSLTETRFELLRGNFVIQAGNPALLRPGNAGPGGIARRQTSMYQALAFEIVTPHGTLTIGKDGLYGISIEPAMTRVDVFEGEVVLGGRSESLASQARKIRGSRRAVLTGDHQTSPVVTKLKLKPYDRFDRWRFPAGQYGMARRAEGGVMAAWGPDQTDMHRISLEFQLRGGQMLSTAPASYLELMTSIETYVCLGQQTRIRAVKSETDEAVFELLGGSLIANSSGWYPMRPIKIITPGGSLAVKRGTLARIDVNGLETEVRVWRGGLRAGATTIGRGRRVLLKDGTRTFQETGETKDDAFDMFERWSLGLLRVATVTRHEGRATIVRQGGGRLDLDKSPPELWVELLEGGHVSTEREGRAALSFAQGAIHVDQDSEIVAVSSTERAREFAVLRGSAMVYADTPTALYGRMDLKVSTPHGLIEISGGGAFRFDVNSSGTRIRVRSGALLIVTGKAAPAKPTIKLKEKQIAYLSGGGEDPKISVVPDKFDDFDRWSIGAREFPFPRIVRNQ